MEDYEERKRLLSDQKSQFKIQSSMDFSVSKIDQSTELEITQFYVERILKNHLSEEHISDKEKKISMRASQMEKLKKPPTTESEFKYTWPFHFRIRNIMTAAHNGLELKLQQFEQFEKLFKLSSKKIKNVNCPDPVTLQTLRYAIYNKQQITAPLVEVINQMAKTNLAKNWETAIDIFHKLFMFQLVCQIFEPPLDLYIEFVDTGLIQPSQQQLNEVFTRNQFLYKSLCNDKQFYQTLSQKKRLIYNQFPYLLDIYNRIKDQFPSDYNFTGFKLYLSTILSFLQSPTQDYLLERYLPEIKCLYFKIKSNLNISEIQYLFVILKSLQSLNKDDFKILYSTKPSKNITIKQHKIKSWIRFWKVEEICSNVFTKKDFHLTQKQMQQMSEELDFQKLLCPEIIKCHLYLIMLREQAYNNQSFPKNLIKKIGSMFKKIPDRHKKKQCCYLLLLQYYKLIHQNPEKRNQIVEEYAFPEEEMDTFLDNGRELALDLLLNEEYKKLIFDESKCKIYLEIVKKLMSQTKNKTIRNKAFQLYGKLNKDNKFETNESNFYELNILKDNTLVQLIEIQAINGKLLRKETIRNIIKILTENNDPLIKRTCLTTLKSVVKNHKIGQSFPQQFYESFIKIIMNLYFEDSLSIQCKIQIIKLFTQCTNMPGTYVIIENFIKFFIKIFMKTSYKSALNINATYGLYSICLNFKQKSQKNYDKTKQFIDVFGTELSTIIKKTFESSSKGSINILCCVVALAKNQINLPTQLLQQITMIAMRNKNLIELALLGVLLHVKNVSSNPISQKSMVHICQILQQQPNPNIKLQIAILQACYRKTHCLPNSIIQKLNKLKHISQNLLSFYKNNQQSHEQITNLNNKQDKLIEMQQLY